MLGMFYNRWVILVFVVGICVVQYFLLIEIIRHANSSEPAVAKTTKGSQLRIASERITDVAQQGNRRNRIAVLLPYLGRSLPAWFDLFAFTAHTSSDLIDWYIFITEAPMRAVPENVHLIRMSRSDIFRRLAQLDERYSVDVDTTTMEAYFQRIIDIHPYILVEIKPALGFLFSDYTEGYSHWAYADLDLLVGRMQMQLTPELLLRHDIITLSFGDNNRLYMRGQFTIHKNNDMTKQLWRGCPYLTQMGARLESFFTARKKWDFHSAEGCYSRVVADDTRLSVLYVPIQFSDAFPGSMDQKETLLLGGALQRCYGHAVTDSVLHHSYDVAHVPRSSSSARRVLNRISTTPLRCSYWIDPHDQVCTEFVPPNATIALEQSLMSYITGSGVIENRFVDDHCREASIAHFQGWKRDYYAFVARLPSSDAHAMVITEVGVVPLKLRTAGAIAYGNSPSGSVLRAGRLLPMQASAGGSRGLSAPLKAVFAPLVQRNPPHQRTSLLRRHSHPAPAASEVTATSYCLQHSADLKRCERPLSMADLVVLPAAHKVQWDATTAVTLIAVGWLSEFRVGAYDAQCNSYDGPKMLVLAYMKPAESIAGYRSHLPNVALVLVNISSAFTTATDSATSPQRSWRLPDKTLFNIGLDAAATDHVLLVPMRGALWRLDLAIQGSGAVAATPLQEAYRALRMQDVVEHFRSVPQSEGYGTSGLSPALIFPVFTSAPKAAGAEVLCGGDQPASLSLSLERIQSGGWVDLPFSGQELSMEHTTLLAVALDTSTSPHGRDFARLPEELNGLGCHDLMLLRVLAGAGFKLAWAVSNTSALVQRDDKISSSGGYRSAVEFFMSSDATDGGMTPNTQCGCASGDGKARHDFVVKTNRYFQKAVELRSRGLANTFSRERFGVTMEREQGVAND